MVGVIVENDSGTTFAENINSVTFGTTSAQRATSSDQRKGG
jgi:hypothetical protein